MRIILTHEQADFDALASLLGAYLLDEASIPVLPHRMNRNVRAFVTLYGADLPFVEARDLQAGFVESVCLVDTQTMVSIRGVSPQTRVHVIDHHALKINLPPAWTVVTDEVGATTTLLVEQLRERDGKMSILQATLLLLGIYEDTGSLTYSRTTPRDLIAASYLLEQGANLTLAADFINHPLSADQQLLYDELRSQLTTHNIHGHHISIACGDAKELDEELSTVAHKLRDLLDPDALFLLVNTRGGVQMIARSTTDHIDVADIAAQFGGGGHARAAASLIRDRTLNQVYQELLRVLQVKVTPAITVAEIMSRGPQVIGPEVPAQEAADLMQRYGYEGYPVVQNGKIIGLLTRRAVDRAISHKLNLSASSLMNAGEIAVFPGDSIEHLQRVMTESGWGQIPVIHPESKEIIGIVTRTDLLKTLTTRMEGPRTLNLAEKLEKVLPPIRLQLLKIIAEIALTQRAALYMVGGFVRDLILERPSLDFDLVVEGDAISLGAELTNRYGGRLTTHHRFGTAKWLLKGTTNGLRGELADINNIHDLPPFLDLITARTEFYTHPTALPTVERGSIKLDLHRRDFTINTLALRLDGNHYGDLYDYWGGLSDLNEKLVRVLHSLSFVDDPTRILRAVRFEQRFGFQIETRTLQLLIEARSLLAKISGDRIRHELDHILDEENRGLMLARLDQLGLLKLVHPSLSWEKPIEERFQRMSQIPLHYSDGFPKQVMQNLSMRTLAYSLLLMDKTLSQVKDILTRLRMPVTASRHILMSCELWHDLPEVVRGAPSQITHRLENYHPSALYAACLAANDGRICDIFRTYLTHWRNVAPSTNGYDLRVLGVPPGPAYKNILGALRDAWLDEVITNEKEERLLLDKLVRIEINKSAS
jgi:tRNA nucleotidyltransferase (CCA-adding enzyme)